MKKISIKKYYSNLINRIKALKGEPHSLALGMALGVFTALTPTFPVQTFIAIMLAFVFKASRPAAIIGSLFSNPITIPFIYLASYKIGAIFIKTEAVCFGGENPLGLKELFEKGTDVAFLMLLGGAVLGALSVAPVYFIFRKIFARLTIKN